MKSDCATAHAPKAWPTRKALDYWDVELLTREPLVRLWCLRCNKPFFPRLGVIGKPRRGAYLCPRGCNKGYSRKEA